MSFLKLAVISRKLIIFPLMVTIHETRLNYKKIVGE